MGRGLYEPVDDIRDDSESANPALSNFLEEQMIALGYDMKQFLRAIYNTKAYGMKGSLANSPLSTNTHFKGPSQTPER